MEDREAGRADSDVRQAQAPGAAKRVADDDGDAFAGPLAKCSRDFSCGAIRILRKQSNHIVVGNIRMVHASIGTDIAVASFGNQHGIGADKAAGFFQDDFHKARVFLLPQRDGLRLGRRLDRFQLDDRAFSLRNNLLRDDEDVAVFKMHAHFAGSDCNLFGEIFAAANLGQSWHTDEAHIGIGSRSLFRRRAGYGTLGHTRRKKSYATRRELSSAKMREMKKRAERPLMGALRPEAAVELRLAARRLVVLGRLAGRLVLFFRGLLLAFLLLFLLELLLLLRVFLL